MSTLATTTLWRPVGLREMELILDVDATGFPPRLPEQPIFYPVTNPGYAAEIAATWNAKEREAGFVGYVTEFDVDATYAARFRPQTVGAARHRELWVPAHELADFNRQIASPIRIHSAHYGTGYVGPVPIATLLKDRAASAQPAVLLQIRRYNGMDFILEVSVNWRLVLLNYCYWARAALDVLGVSEEERAELLSSVAAVWPRERPPLPANCSHSA